MAARKWLIVSLGVNALLALTLVWRNTSSAPSQSPSTSATPPASWTNQGKTNLVVRRQNFTWHEVESDNYATYIGNLRDLGCPESTIRDIIVADVDQLYAHKRVSDVASADHQWWRSDPDPQALEDASTAMTALETERRALLSRLLGANWDAPQNPLPPAPRTGISLSGPVLGALTSEKKQGLYEITARAQSAMESYMATQEAIGKPLDTLQLARMRQQTRLEVAQVLSPAEMEEFLLRYSKTAQDLREEVRGLNVSSNEFRALFKARDPIDQQLDLFYNGSAAGTLKEREKTLQQREMVAKEILGAERFATLRLSRDPIFAETQERAQQMGMPAETVLPVYEINQLSQKTATRIQTDARLSPEEKAAALHAVQEEQQKSLEKLLGPDWASRYRAATRPPAATLPPVPGQYSP